MDTIFEVEHLNKTYGEGTPAVVRAVDDVTLTISRGEFSALVGPSGSGKSTLLNLLSGLDTPTTGSIKLVGKDLGGMSETELSDFRRDHIGFVFQSYNLIPVLTVAENIEYITLLQRVDEKKRRERVEELLEEVGLSGLGRKFPNQLSGGQQQRVAVARAIASKPDIVLADEPTANLDSKTGELLLDMMHGLNEKHNVTFVFSTHDQMIMDRAKRLIKLRDGHLVH